MSSNNIQAYYENLRIPSNARCIRLLHVQAPVAAEGFNGPLYCDLSVHELATKPLFTALSYVWGVMSSCPDTVVCGGLQLPISANGLSALRHLRAKLGAFIIWIDALCINQLDDNEKASQIPLMGTIYQNAATTYFWLGEINPGRQKAMEYFHRAGMTQYYFKNRNVLWNGGVTKRKWAAAFHLYLHEWKFKHNPILYNLERYPLLRRILPSIENTPTFHDVEVLLDCRWITRIWTYQEAILAHNPVVVSGHSHMDWQRFSLNILFVSGAFQCRSLHRWLEIVFSRARFQTELGGKNVQPEQLEEYVDFCVSLTRLAVKLRKVVPLTIWMTCSIAVGGAVIGVEFTKAEIQRPAIVVVKALPAVFVTAVMLAIILGFVHCAAPGRWYPTWNHGWDMKVFLTSHIHERLFETLAMRQASEPRDMIFGLHSVLEHYSAGVSDGLKLDYHDSSEMIYRNWTRHMMLKAKTLEPLLLAARKSYPGGPSWVPDYSCDLQFLFPPGAYRYTATGRYRSNRYMRACPHDDAVLIVKGFLFDEVKAAQRFQPTSSEYDNAQDHTHLKNLELLMKWGHYFVSEGEGSRKRDYPLDRKFLQDTTTLAIPSMTLPDIRAYLDILRAGYSKFRLPPPRKRLKSSREIKRSACIIWGKLIAQSTRGGNLLRTHIEVMNNLAQTGFKMLRTAEGRIGCLFGNVERGDKLYLISGVTVPLVMRMTSSELRLISTVYIAETLGEDGDFEPSVRFGELWISEMKKLQEEGHRASGGQIPHPKDARLYEWDPDNVLETLLPDVHIH